MTTGMASGLKIRPYKAFVRANATRYLINVGSVVRLHYNRLKPEDLVPPERRTKWLIARTQICNYRMLLIQRADRVVRPYIVINRLKPEDLVPPERRTEWLIARTQIC